MTHAIASGGLAAALLVASLCPLSAASGSVVPGSVPEPRATREPYRLEARLSPDARWVAVCGSRGWSDEVRCWLVPVDTGVQREITDIHPSGSQALGWDSAGHVRVQVVNTDFGVPEMRWIDVETGAIARWTRDRDAMRDEVRAHAAPWGRVDERRTIDGRTLHSVRWETEGLRSELEARGPSRVELSPEPGVGFFTTSFGGIAYLKRFEVASGIQREIAQSNAASFHWSVSADGRKLLVAERTLESRVRVLDAASGALVDGPWMAESPRWVEGCDGRYFVAISGDRRVLIDLLRDRVLEVGTSDQPCPEIVALPNGRFVVEDDHEVALYDADWRRERALFAAPSEISVARR